MPGQILQACLVRACWQKSRPCQGCWTQAGLFWWEYVFRYAPRSRIYPCLPSLALRAAAFSEAEVWPLFRCGLLHPGDPANPTFMMRKTDRENNRLLANRHSKNSLAGSLYSVGLAQPSPAQHNLAQPGVPLGEGGTEGGEAKGS